MRLTLEIKLTLAIMAIFLVGVFATTSCDEKKAESFLAEIISAELPALAQAVLNDPSVKDAIGEGGEPLAQAAVAVLLPLLQNEISELAISDNPDHRVAYKRIRASLGDDVAAVVYRVDANGIPHGLWPRLEAWLSVKGYCTAAELWRDLEGRTTTIVINPADRAELKKLMLPAIIEEAEAVIYGKRHYSLPDFEAE